MQRDVPLTYVEVLLLLFLVGWPQRSQVILPLWRRFWRLVALGRREVGVPACWVREVMLAQEQTDEENKLNISTVSGS